VHRDLVERALHLVVLGHVARHPVTAEVGGRVLHLVAPIAHDHDPVLGRQEPGHFEPQPARSADHYERLHRPRVGAARVSPDHAPGVSCPPMIKAPLKQLELLERSFDHLR
jgi:hypothetical protein